MSYQVRFAVAAARQFRKLTSQEQGRIRGALEKVAARPPGQRGGKTLKVIRRRDDRFFRLRLGDYRVMFDVLAEERVVLVLGVIHRSDLERWLRGR